MKGVTTSRTLIKKGAAKFAEMGNAVPIVGYSVLSFGRSQRGLRTILFSDG